MKRKCTCRKTFHLNYRDENKYDLERTPIALRLASTTGWAKQRGVRAFEVWREITCVCSEALLPQVYVSDALV